MSENIPSTLAHGEALKLIRELQEGYEGDDVSFEKLVEELSQILVAFQNGAGKPRLQYDPVVETEPPSSQKTNKAWQRMEDDINLLKSQTDLTRAAAVLTHNIISTEIEDLNHENARVENKLKTVQLYSVDDSPGVLSFSDTFNDTNQIDINLIPREDRPSVINDGDLTLGVTGEMVNLTPEASITIDDEWSNGFLGNNQAIESIDDPPVNPVNDKPHYEFKAENRDYRNFDHITDREPDTWIEYESYHIAESDRPLGVNFTYRRTDGEDSESVDWAERPSDDMLRLQLNFDLGDRQIVNSVELTPKGFGEKGYPIYVKSVNVSSDGTTWSRVGGDTWVGAEPSIRTARAAENIVIGSGVWGFESRSIRYVRIQIEQPSGMKANAGYVYWVDSDDDNIVDGPEPHIDDPQEILSVNTHDGAVQQRDHVQARRWAIGLSDVGIIKRTYRGSASLITTLLRIGGVVDRVILDDVEMTIPDSYSSEDLWIRFFISPDNGSTWNPIAPIQDDFYGIPQQIAYNDPTPEAFREPGVQYHEIDDTVDSLRLKAELTRPEGHSGTTPILHSYSLKVLRRE